MTILKITNDYIRRMFSDFDEEEYKILLEHDFYHMFSSKNTDIYGPRNSILFSEEIFLTKSKIKTNLTYSFVEEYCTDKFEESDDLDITNFIYGKFYKKLKLDKIYYIYSNVELIIQDRQLLELDSEENNIEIINYINSLPSLKESILALPGQSTLKDTILNYNLIK